MFERKKVVITGAAGFIGSHLCHRFLGEGWDVTGIDNFFTGTKRNIKGLIDHDRFDFIRHDVVFPIPVPDADLVLNFACPASPVHYQKYPLETMKTSVLGIINILDLCQRTNARLVQASTSEVYGDPQVHPQPENYWGHVNPVGERSCYDEGKRAAETFCFDYKRQFGMDVRILRIFNTYGPNMAPDDGRVVSNFIVQALLGKDLTIYGTGQQTRSFCFVSDLVEGIYRMAIAEKSSITGPINLGNTSEFTMRELADKVLSKIETDSTIVTHPLPSDDPKLRQPNLDRAKNVLGWSPTVSLDEGLDRTIPYFRDVLNKVGVQISETETV